MAPHSSTLAWKIPWMEGPGGLQSMGSLGVRHDWATSQTKWLVWVSVARCGMSDGCSNDFWSKFFVLFLVQGGIHHFSFQTHGGRSVKFRYNSLNWEYALSANFRSAHFKFSPLKGTWVLPDVPQTHKQLWKLKFKFTYALKACAIFHIRLCMQHPTLPWQIIETHKNLLLIFLQHV